jgi:hypothetical protein
MTPWKRAYGTHVLAYLLAHVPGKQVGECTVEEHPEGFPWAQREAPYGVPRSDRREVADEGESGPERQQRPRPVLGRAQPELPRAHRRRIELDSGVALAFDLLLDPGEYFRVHRLRAGVSAPQAPANGGKEEQRIGRNDQQDGKEKHVLRPEDHPRI